MILPPMEKHFASAAKLASAAETYLDRILEHAWLSYLLIAALEVKVLWKIWPLRDLTTGDTSAYFAGAYRWAEHLGVDIVWSPLYTAFYGTLISATNDPYLATIFHRVIIVVAATFGVLALMRSLLPPALALLIAAWWVILPIVFETLYEVHLFAVLPILAAWLVTTAGDSVWTRGSALAILFATMVLVRNEQSVAVVVFGLICVVCEYREWSGDAVRGNLMSRQRVAGYGIPLVAAAALCAAFYWRSDIKFPAIIGHAASKHTLNMCQVYAFGYSQRHPDWTLSPWTECSSLMEATFGNPGPTLGQMIESNPTATIEHVLWNLSLTLNGFQVGLFNAMSGTINPDYVPVHRNLTSLVLSAAVALLLVAGAIKAARQRAHWYSAWFRDRRDTWLVMLACLCVALPVIATQRPRPSYLFPAFLVVMTLIGSAAHILLGRRWSIFPKAIAVVGVPILAILVPSYYVRHDTGRPLYTHYERLRPFAAVLADPRSVILFGDYGGELRSYLLVKSRPSASLTYSILPSWHVPQTLDAFLDSHGINVVYIQPRIIAELKARPEAQQLLDQPQSLGWRRLAPIDPRESDWLLLVREPRSP